MAQSHFTSGDMLLSARDREQSIPLQGEKLQQPGESWQEEQMLETRLIEHKALLQEPKVARRDQLSKGLWLPESRMVQVTSHVGNFWHHMGAETDIGKCLYPEEALYLIDTCELEVAVGGVGLSMQQAQTMLLEDEQHLDRYLVYAHLSRTGSKVLRHQPHLVYSNYEKQIRLDQHQAKRKRKLKLKDQDKTPPSDIAMTAHKNQKPDESLHELYALLGDAARNPLEEQNTELNLKNTQSEDLNADAKKKESEITPFEKKRLELLDMFPDMYQKKEIFVKVPPSDLLPKGVEPQRDTYKITSLGLWYYSRYEDGRPEADDDWRNSEHSNRGQNNTRHNISRGRDAGSGNWRDHSERWGDRDFNDGHRKFDSGDRSSPDQTWRRPSPDDTWKHDMYNQHSHNRMERTRGGGNRDDWQHNQDDHDPRGYHKHTDERWGGHKKKKDFWMHDDRWSDEEHDQNNAGNSWNREQQNRTNNWRGNARRGEASHEDNNHWRGQGAQGNNQWRGRHMQNDNNMRNARQEDGQEQYQPEECWNRGTPERRREPHDNSDSAWGPSNRVSYDGSGRDQYSRSRGENFNEGSKNENYDKRQTYEDVSIDYNIKPKWKYKKRRKQRQMGRDYYPCDPLYQMVAGRTVRSWKDFKRIIKEASWEDIRTRGPVSILWTGHTVPLLKPGPGITTQGALADCSLESEVKDWSVYKDKLPPTSRLTLHYDVYLPAVTYKKTNPPPPSKRVVVIQGSRMPSPGQILELTSRYQDGVGVVCAMVVGGEVRMYSLTPLSLPPPETVVTLSLPLSSSTSSR